MTQVIDAAVRPRLSSAVSLTLDAGELRIDDGTYRASARADGARLSDLRRLHDGMEPARLLDEMAGWLGSGEEIARAFIARLFEAGLLVDPSAHELGSVPGSYVACRLLDVYRRTFPSAVADAPLLRALADGRHPGLALGFLVETYFVVRAARWTSAPVVGHDMTDVQRAALDDFRASESGHGELLVAGFAAAGLDVEYLSAAAESVETMAYSHAYGAFAVQGVAEFAAALILPEVPAQSGSGIDVLDLLAAEHGIPAALLHNFRLHEDDDVEGDHAGLPFLLLAECRELPPDRVSRLFTVLRQMIDLYRGHLDGVYRRYRDWAPSSALPENAYRHVRLEHSSGR